MFDKFDLSGKKGWTASLDGSMSGSMEWFSVRVERLLVAGAMGCASVLMASVFQPRGTMAGQATAATPAANLPAMKDSPAASLGELIGRRHRVTVIATATDHDSQVRDLSGTLLGEALTADEAQSLTDDPQLKRQLGVHAHSHRLMLVDPDRSHGPH